MIQVNSGNYHWLLDTHVASMRMHTFVTGIIFCLLFLSACSGSRPTTDIDTPREATLEDKLRVLPQYETFDPSPYPSDLVIEESEPEHLVPVELMEGRASDGLGSRQTGFRVQIALVREKNNADILVDEVSQLLQKKKDEDPRNPLFQGELPIHNIYVQPYFRVRLGDFTDREKAEQLRSQIVDEYPGALVVVDNIALD